jgi:hypothetical protein
LIWRLFWLFGVPWNSIWTFGWIFLFLKHPHHWYFHSYYIEPIDGLGSNHLPIYLGNLLPNYLGSNASSNAWT